jgi:hypothetical protein
MQRRVLLDAGMAELTRLIASTSGRQQGQERAGQWQAAAAAAVEFYGDHPAVPYAELAAEVATEGRLPRATWSSKTASAWSGSCGHQVRRPQQQERRCSPAPGGRQARRSPASSGGRQ